MDVKNKVAIVTGGTGGIGFATVQALLKNGAKHVAIFDVEAAEDRAVPQLQKLIGDHGKDRASFFVCDVTNSKQFETCYDALVKSQNGVDILVNNAGIVSETRANLMIDINVKGVVNSAVTAIERMGKHNNGKGGTIVNVASTAGFEPGPVMAIYSATKSAVLGFTKSLKETYPYTGVRVVAVCPDATQTGILKQNWRDDKLNFVQDKFVEELKSCFPDAQPPENVAKAIVKAVKEAEAGAIWVSKANQPPYEVADPPHYWERKILLN